MVTNSYEYRIYVGHGIQFQDVNKYLEGYTLYDAVGVWKGATEYAGVIEYLGTEGDTYRIQALARDLKDKYNQELVLVTAKKVRLEHI